MLHLRFCGDSEVPPFLVILQPLLLTVSAVLLQVAVPANEIFATDLPVKTSSEALFANSRTIAIEVLDQTRFHAAGQSSSTVPRLSPLVKHRQRKPLIVFFAQETMYLCLAILLLASGIEANPGPSTTSRCCLPDCHSVDRPAANTATF